MLLGLTSCYPPLEFIPNDCYESDVIMCNDLSSMIGMTAVAKRNMPNDLEAALVVMPSSRSNVRYSG